MARDRGRRRRRSKKESAIAIQEEAEEEECIVEKEEEEQPLAMDADDDESDLFFEPHSPPTSSPLPHPTSNNNRSIIYFLLSFAESNPVSQALYAVDASPMKHSDNNLKSEKIIYPVFEFTNQDGFPDHMCCAVLDSRIYFLGGYVFHGDEIIYSKKVYCIDAASMSLAPTDPRSVLRKAAPMTSGKPQCYCFVALGLLFAICVQDWTTTGTVFEVYDPKLDKWTPLEDPPITAYVVSDAVVDNMVILVTMKHQFYSFDAATRRWKNLSHLPDFRATCYMGVIQRGIFLDDNIYWSDYTTVISSGPTTRVDPADIIVIIPINNCPSTRLQYLGNRIFASVVCGLEDPYLPDCPGDPEKSKASIVVFEIPEDESGGGGHDQKEDIGFEEEGSEELRFEVTILHAARFECRSNKGADHTDIFLEDCFSIL